MLKKYQKSLRTVLCIKTGRESIEVVSATSFLQRAIGLLSKPNLSSNAGLYLPNCKSIHTFGMRFTIDVLYLDKHKQVLEIATVQPWKYHWHLSADSVLELAGGAASYHEIEIGRKLWD